MSSKAKTNGARKPKRHLFSYGTLLPHRASPEIAPTIRKFRRIGRGFVRGRLFDFGEYPGAVLSSTGAQIKGQIFELPDDPAVLGRLDDYEGFDPANPAASLFRRRRRFVTAEDGRRIWCWIYEYNRPLRGAMALAGNDSHKVR